MQSDGMVARSVQQYVTQARRLADDDAWRLEVLTKLHMAAHAAHASHGSPFEDQRAVVEWTRFLHRVGGADVCGRGGREEAAYAVCRPVNGSAHCCM